MKATIDLFLKALPFAFFLGLGGWLVYDNMSTKNELSNVRWELAGVQKDLETAEYNLAQEKKWQEERKQWNKELDAELLKFKKTLDSYTIQLKSIENERKNSGISNSLSEPVSRVLKDFNQN